MMHRSSHATLALAALLCAAAWSCAGNDGAIAESDSGGDTSGRPSLAHHEAGLDGSYDGALTPNLGPDVAAGSSSGSEAGSAPDAFSGSGVGEAAPGRPALEAGSSNDSGSGSSSGSDAGSDSGGGSSGVCTWGTPYNGNGSFTWYYFGQGTSQSGGRYKTACGYAGSESGSGPSAVDMVGNIANTAPAKNTYFAAIPGSSPSAFDTVTSCGACVEITGMNKTKIVATIVDECPRSTNPLCTANHLDLSTQAFNALGYAVGNPSGTTWKFVPCPVTGNIVAVANSGSQFYMQNSAYPITSVNGRPPSNWGYFDVSPGNVTITSAPAGKTISGRIPAGGGDTGAQFSAAPNCY